MDSRISRRSLVSRASALGAGAALSGSLVARAQSTPVASPAAAADAPAAEAAIQRIRDMGGSLRMLSAVVGGKNPDEDQLWAEEFTRLTGVELELVHPTADYDEKLLADLAAGVEYDLIYMNKNRMDVLVEEDILTELTDRIEGSDLLQDPQVIPTEEWELISYDGTFYSVFNKFEGARMLTTRQDWLDQLGLEAPRTLDEVYNTMVAFRDENPGGTDTPPLGLSTSGTYDIQPFMSSEGIYPGYVMNGDARTIPYVTEAAIPVYQWLADLYAEGLYDQNFATATTADMRNLFLTDAVGFVTYWDTWVGLFNNVRRAEDPDTSFQAVGIAATEGPEGIVITRGQPSVWTIPVNAPNPDLAFAFMEWWNTAPGIRLGSLGIEGHDFTVDNGTYELTEVGQEHSMDHGMPTPYSEYWENPIGTLPGLEDAQAISKEYGYLEQLGPDWEPSIKPILDETIIQIILGDVAPEDGVSSMHEQLLNEGLIDE